MASRGAFIVGAGGSYLEERSEAVVVRCRVQLTVSRAFLIGTDRTHTSAGLVSPS